MSHQFNYFEPSVSWKGIGGYTETIKEFIDFADFEFDPKFEKVRRVRGMARGEFFLFGPKGCGKSLLAKCLASSWNANFLVLEAPEKEWKEEDYDYVHEAFKLSKTIQPLVIFIKEVEKFVENDRIYNSLLTNLDHTRKEHLLVIGSSDHPSKVSDRVIFRPGRLDMLTYIPFPSELDRKYILTNVLFSSKEDSQKNNVETKIIDIISSKTIGFSCVQLTQFYEKYKSDFTDPEKVQKLVEIYRSENKIESDEKIIYERFFREYEDFRKDFGIYDFRNFRFRDHNEQPESKNDTPVPAFQNDEDVEIQDILEDGLYDD